MTENLTEGQVRYRKYKDSYRAYRLKNKVRYYYPESNKKSRDKFMFGGNRVKVLERDNYQCVKCGMTNEEHLKKWD